MDDQMYKKISVQFLKYALIGFAGTFIYASVFSLLNETVLMADQSLAAGQRSLNYFLSNSVAFLCSSIFVYLFNRNWVFIADRHSRLKEIILFYAVAFVAYLIGTPAGAYLISQFNWNEYYALGITVVASVLVNFIGRKMFVFHS